MIPRNPITNNNPTHAPGDLTVASKPLCIRHSVPLLKKKLSMTLVKDGKSHIIQGLLQWGFGVRKLNSIQRQVRSYSPKTRAGGGEGVARGWKITKISMVGG